jgi:single-stranded-DNA-specific exonuclease
MTARRKRWLVRDPAPREFIASQPFSPVVATLLHQRNLRDDASIRAFLQSDYRTGLHDPLLMKDMDAASARIAQAIASGEQMAVYGDYDTDGVTSVALLMQVLPALGGRLRPYIPHRTREGYGLNHEAIETLAADGTSLLITVDCGISNLHEVARAKALGLDVIVTDHHTPPPQLPEALAVVNPKQPGCAYPYKQLVGVGIAYKLVQALVRQGLRLPLKGRELLDVVAVGTVTDMGPLNGENRVLVKHGLDALNSTARPGLRALISAAGLKAGQVTSTDIGFGLGPRINAAGRLDDAIRSYQLLLASDFAEATRLAQELNSTNRQRQELTKQVQAQARAQAQAEGLLKRRVVLIAGEGFPAGVVGLVAGRLVEEWGRPVLLLERGAEHSVGSARSIPDFNIIEALSACSELFVRFGGHSMAAGFTIANERLAELDARLQELAAAQLNEELLTPRLDIDAEVPLKELNWDLLRALQALEPFGQANQMPVLMSSRAQVLAARAIGSDGQHLKLKIGNGNGLPPLDAIAFRLGHLAEPLTRHPIIDIAYSLEEHVWNGERSLQLNVKDFRRAQ